jgi:hypothetical protein
MVFAKFFNENCHFFFLFFQKPELEVLLILKAFFNKKNLECKIFWLWTFSKHELEESWSLELKKKKTQYLRPLKKSRTAQHWSFLLLKSAITHTQINFSYSY